MFTVQPKALGKNSPQRIRPRPFSDSEIMTIIIASHQSGYRNFKEFYIEYVRKHLDKYFPKLVSYNRILELMAKVILLLTNYLAFRFDKPTGISFIYSTLIQVCKPKHISRNKVFKNTTKIGKSTSGWFFGFKLHLIVNEKGGILSVKFTKGNTDDRTPVFRMVKNLFGKLFGDKGYISKKLTTKLQTKNVTLITGLKKNMKNKLLLLSDKILLRKRFTIETINEKLKNISNIEHSRQRSTTNFVVNLLGALIAYIHQPKKPRITGIPDKFLISWS